MNQEVKNRRSGDWGGVVFSASCIALAMVAVPDAAAAQESSDRGVDVHLAASHTRIGLYGGDATVGSVGVGGWSLAARIRTGHHIGGEAFFSFSSAQDNPYNRAPGLKLAGAAATVSLSDTPHAGFDAYAGLGVTSIRVDEWIGSAGCRIEDGCFAEGGPSFANGEDTAPLVVGGVSYAFEDLLIGADLRVVGQNDQARQVTTLLGFGVGWSLF